MSTKKYKGSCYIGVVGGEMENGLCRDSIEAIKKRDGDIGPHSIRATKGYEARQMHLNNWYYNTKHPFILFLDHDMIFPEDTLERLRSHGLPYISGYYPRRALHALPIWFDNNAPGVMPFRPTTSIPEDRALYQIGATGWGCVLIHRDVVRDVKAILKGEPEIIEDDMDVWPYDLGRVMKALRMLDNLTVTGSIREIQEQVSILQDEFRPLRGLKDTVGSDIRFPFFAKVAGYQLWGDSGVKCRHMINYPLTFEDYASRSGLEIRNANLEIHRDNLAEIERIRKATE